MKKLLILTLMVFTQHLWAANPWSGHWRGFATMMEIDGAQTDCGEVEILINHQKQPKWESLWVMSGFPSCGLPSALGVSFQMDIKNGGLVHMGQTVGEYAANELKIVRPSESFKEEIELMQISSDELLYRKYFTYKGPLESYIVEARLYR